MYLIARCRLCDRGNISQTAGEAAASSIAIIAAVLRSWFCASFLLIASLSIFWTDSGVSLGIAALESCSVIASTSMEEG
eukprot:IDg14206t1